MIVIGFKALYGGTVAENEHQLKQAQTKLRDLRLTLQKNGIHINKSIEALPARLNRRYKAGGANPGLRESVEQFQQKRERLRKILSHFTFSSGTNKRNEQNRSPG